MEVELKNVCKKIDDTPIVTNVSFSIGKGETFALVGPNGAGKTTLIRLILNLYNIDSGEIVVDGISVNDKNYKAKKSKIGFLLDNIGLFKDLTAWENLEFFHRIYYKNCSTAIRNDKISSLLKEVDLYSKRDKKISFFSRGMKQRLAICRAVINDPKLLILDEPARGLDIEGQYLLRQFIEKLKENQCTVLINSHDLSEVEKICSKIAFIQSGKILECDTYEELCNKFSQNIYSLSTEDIAICISKLSIEPDVKLININDNDKKLLINLNNNFDLPTWLNNNNIKIMELKKITTSLEDIYKNIIKNGEKQKND